MNDQLVKAAPDLADVTWRARGEEGPPGADAPPGAYEKWYASLTDNSGSKRIQPILNESFDKSDIATQLKSSGVTEGSDTWNQYKDTFAKDATMQYNNYWGNI